nr:hypothetical protein [Tanacetum cinerariifolium]
MLNNVRLEVEEESEVSLELLSFGVDAAKEFKENMLSDYCCQAKLMMLINAPVAPTTAEQRLARKNELKARGTLLMALLDKHQLKFNTHKDAKTLMEEIKKRFGGNTKPKKVQKTLLKQQHENFICFSFESLDQIHDRLQKLISQLEILRVSLSQEDINLKFLRSLPTEWRTHTLIWRNKTDLEEQSLDDLFNSLKIYEVEVKSSSSASTSTQNIAFVFSSNTDSTNEPVSAAASVSAISAKIYVSALPNVDSLSNAVIYSFFASQSNSLRLENDDLKPTDADDLEEMDLKWQMAMLTVRARRFFRGQEGILELINLLPWDLICLRWSVTTATGKDTLVFKQKRNPPTMLLWPSLLLVLLLTMRQNLEKAEQERDDLKLKLEKFQTSSKNLSKLLASQTNNKTGLGYNSQVFTHAMFDCDDYLTSGSDESLPPSPIYDSYQSGNGTLIEAARTMLTDLLLPILLWTEAVNTACYVQNRVLVTTPQNKTPYELLHGRTPREKNVQQYVLFPVWSSGSTNPHNTDGDAAFDVKKPEFKGRKPESEVNVFPSSSTQSKKHDDKTKREAKGKSPDNAAGTLVPAVRQLSPNSTNTFSAAGPSNAATSPTHGKSSYMDSSQLPDDPNMPESEDITYSDDEDDVGAEADFNNLETSITVSAIPTTRVHKDHLVTEIIGDLSLATQTRSMTRVDKDQGHTLEEGIDYEEVFAPVARIEAIRLFLAYASFMGFIVYQMDVKSAFMYGTIEEEVYVCQSPRSEDPDYPNKVYKVVKIYVDDIIFGSTNKDLCKAFEKLRKDKFQMSSMGELIFFLDGKSASTPIDTEKPLLKDPDGCSKCSPCCSNEELASPDQMVSGKDSLNPSMADNLPKIIWYSAHHVALMKSWLVQKQTALGVNTPRCNEDRLELMELMVLLLPSDEKVRIEVSAVDLQVSAVRLILLLISIKYALTVNPNIYVSCIKQFWTSVAGKKVNDITRLQALVDKKKVVITKSTIRDALRLDDAEGVDCLPNEEIFTELATMGYEKPSTKLTFYKAKQVGDLFSTTTKYSFPALTQKVFANMRRVGKGYSRVETPLFKGMIVEQQVDESATKVNVEDVSTTGVAAEGDASVADDVVPTAVEEPSIPPPTPPTPPSQPSQNQPSTSQVQLTSLPSPIAQPQSPQHQPQPLQDADISIDILQNLLDTCTTLTRRVEHLEQDNVAQALEITKLTQRVKKLERKNKASKLKRLQKVGIAQRIETSDDTVMDDVSKQGRMIADMDADTFKGGKQNPKLKSIKLTLNMLISAARRRKGVVIRDPEDATNTATPSIIIHSEAKSKDEGKGILVEEPKPLKKQAQIEQDEAYAREHQALKRKPQTKAQARKNMMIYIRNVAGFKMDYFKGMTYDDIRPIFEKKFNSNVAFLMKIKEQMDAEDSRALKRLSESQDDKASKKQKLDEEVEELKRHLQIVPNDEDDIYTEATPLALKVPVVDYEIYTENNKPYYKIKRADGSHQLYLSFLSMLRNFDREDLEVLWRLVKERFAFIKPKNFSDDFLLTTLGAMFEKPDIQAQI